VTPTPIARKEEVFVGNVQGGDVSSLKTSSLTGGGKESLKTNVKRGRLFREDSLHHILRGGVSIREKY